MCHLLPVACFSLLLVPFMAVITQPMHGQTAPLEIPLTDTNTFHSKLRLHCYSQDTMQIGGGSHQQKLHLSGLLQALCVPDVMMWQSHSPADLEHVLLLHSSRHLLTSRNPFQTADVSMPVQDHGSFRNQSSRVPVVEPDEIVKTSHRNIFVTPCRYYDVYHN